MNISAEMLRQEVRAVKQLANLCAKNDHGFVEVLQKHAARLERIERAIDGLFPLAQAHDALLRAGWKARLRWLVLGELPAVTIVDAPITVEREPEFSVTPVTPNGQEVTH